MSLYNRCYLTINFMDIIRRWDLIVIDISIFRH